jgi:putative hydrolase of HD superfamily
MFFCSKDCAMLNAPPRLAQQIQFIVELDRLKNVLRRTQLIDGSRHENSAEHSWHLALMALLLHEYAAAKIDVHRVMRMLLVHDIVEIDAGDTFAFDVTGNLSKVERELAAAERIFGLLPEEQGRELRTLWDEFEDMATAESRYANALDRLEPLLQNLHNTGGTWRQYHIDQAAVLRRVAPIQEGMPDLWPFVLHAVDAAVQAGYIA